MNYRKLGFGLGLFSIGLGIVELAAPKRIARGLSAEGQDHVVRVFGARELFAGAALLSGPAHGIRVWNRVAGDAMDLAALSLAARRAPQNRATWGAIAFVAAATTLDIVTAVGLDRTTGKTLPTGQDEASGARRPGAVEAPLTVTNQPGAIASPTAAQPAAAIG